MNMARGDYPSQYSFHVFWTKSEEPTDRERKSGIVLLEFAEGDYLARLFGPLYDEVGIGITTSDDEIIPPSKLSALLEAVVSAIREVKAQPETWPVFRGCRYDPSKKEGGPEVFEAASRASLLEFLEGTEQIIRQAMDAGGYVFFGGGM